MKLPRLPTFTARTSCERLAAKFAVPAWSGYLLAAPRHPAYPSKPRRHPSPAAANPFEQCRQIQIRISPSENRSRIPKD
jgi:hypothetical protein